MNFQRNLIPVLIFLAICRTACTQSSPDSLDGNRIRINQLGYYPDAPKIGVVVGSAKGGQTEVGAGVSLPFYILSATGNDTVFRGVLGQVTPSLNSSLLTRIADFSELRKPGTYSIVVPGPGRSYSFRIGKDVMSAVSVASLKGYYYQRSAMRLDKTYAGQWSRPAGHPDTQVWVHPSAGSPDRPAGTSISSVGGWYDAGDYNKYIVNSGITMGTLLDAYEDFPAYFDSLHTNIPESGNGIPDILSESLYNLRWMLTMQDPGDGGVYNKCTNAAFDGMVMPGFTKAPRYVVQKGTAATLDFTAVMAQAARILRKFSRQLPGLSDTCLEAASRAWAWATVHPDLEYDQDGMNKLYSPKITTGAYGDRDFRDEWFWAATELWISTMQIDKAIGGSQYGKPISDRQYDKPASGTQYEKVIEERINDPMRLPSWANVYMMGAYTLLRYRNALPGGSDSGIRIDGIRSLSQRLLQIADDYTYRAVSNAFHAVMGGSARDFVWGSNSVAANQGVLLINAWLLTGEGKYIDGALGNLDYLLGRNATGYSFVTDIGSNPPRHPHHRPSIADGVVPPVPGLLVGGPNPGRQDHQHYELTEPETAYADLDAAYASNEIAINWNAPLVYLSGAIEALQYQAGYVH
jgi:endoglucanase